MPRSEENVFTVLIKNIDVLAWPVIALVYPLYATVKVIEGGSREDDKQWLTYWVLYSLITVFELSFAQVLEWFPIWSYAKLFFTCWLVLPQFNGATYVYQTFIRPFYWDPQNTTSSIWQKSKQSSIFDKAKRANIFGRSQQPDNFGRHQQPNNFGRPQQPYNYGKAQEPYNYGKPQQPYNYGKHQQPLNYGKPQQPYDFGKPQQPYDYGKPQQPYNFGKPQQPSDFSKPKQSKIFKKKNTILSDAEKYIEENGTGPFEKLIRKAEQESHSRQSHYMLFDEDDRYYY